MRKLEFSGGYNLKLAGKPEKALEQLLDIPDTIAVKALDIQGIKPLVKVKEGDKVKAGDTLFLHKGDQRIKFVTPMSGEVKEVRRGHRRALIEVSIKCDAKQDFGKFSKINLDKTSEADIVNHLLDTGSWPFLRQMPYNCVADPETRPRDIFVVTQDLEPHTPDLNYVLADQLEGLKKGIEILKKLTRGSIYFSGCKTDSEVPTGLDQIEGTTFIKTEARFPAGDPQVLGYHAAPLRQNEVQWYINAQDLIAIANLFESGKIDPQRTMTICGSMSTRPRYIRSYIGSNVQTLLQSDFKEGDKEYISGGVFTGTLIEGDSHLGFYGHSLHVIPMGNRREFLRFMWPGLDKYSYSRVFMSTLFPRDEYTLSNSHQGEERACIQCGHCENVCPVDILPQFLFKAVMAEEYDMAEGLGVKDCAECNLCTYVCPSKIEVSGIIKDGLNTIQKEG